MRKTKLRKTELGIAGIALAGVLLSAGCKSKQAAEPAPLVTVEVAPAEVMSVERKITADAVLFPLRQSAIVPKISAPVGKFHVERGSHVRAGQLLAELESQDLAGAAAESRGGYQQAEAAYETAVKTTVPEEMRKAELDAKAAKESMDALQKVYDSRKSLLQQGAISGKEVDDSLVSLTQARNTYEIAQKHLEMLQSLGKDQEIKAATAQLAAAKGRLQNAEAQLNYTKIVSPIDGVVTDRPFYPGEMASNSAPLVTVMDLTKVIARTHVSQSEAAMIKPGAVVTISVPGQDEGVPGKVTLVSPALDPNSTTVEVWVEAANPGERLKPGSSVRLTILAEGVPNAVVVPAAAVLTDTTGSSSVMVIDAENKPHKKKVTVGIRDGDNVQISEGLEAGEKVVTVGAFELSKEDPEVLEKTKIEVRKPKEKDEDE
jgi:multidrug efflux pump subunit AcrA (membrane-fusion protein)